MKEKIIKKEETTGCERVRLALADGQWHTARELYSSTFTVVHSRISDLRRKGYTIECRRTSGSDARSYQYRLIGGN